MLLEQSDFKQKLMIELSEIAWAFGSDPVIDKLLATAISTLSDENSVIGPIQQQELSLQLWSLWNGLTQPELNANEIYQPTRNRLKLSRGNNSTRYKDARVVFKFLLASITVAELVFNHDYQGTPRTVVDDDQPNLIPSGWHKNAVDALKERELETETQETRMVPEKKKKKHSRAAAV